VVAWLSLAVCLSLPPGLLACLASREPPKVIAWHGAACFLKRHVLEMQVLHSRPTPQRVKMNNVLVPVFMVVTMRLFVHTLQLPI